MNQEYFTAEEIDNCCRNDEKLKIENRGKYPGEVFREKVDKVSQAKRVVITDTDQDGLVTAALLKNKFKSEEDEDEGEFEYPYVFLPASHNRSSVSPWKAMARVAYLMPPNSTLYVTDLNPNSDKQEEWERMINRFPADVALKFRDHHETQEEIVNLVNNKENCEYILDTDRSTARIVLQEDWSDAPYLFEETSRVSQARDLWRRDSELFSKSEMLSSGAYYLGMDEFIDLVSRFGYKIDSDPEVKEYINKRDKLADLRVEWVVESRRIHEINGVTVGTTFGSAYSSEVGDKLLHEYDCDLAIIIEPSGKVSLRSKEGTDYALMVAESYEKGGGHKQAAGCTPFTGEEYEDGITVQQDIHQENIALDERKELLERVRTLLDEREEEE